MFSVQEKQHIAKEIERILLDLNHPEMPSEKPSFSLHVDGKAKWSWADITPNWEFEDGNKKMGYNPFNEDSRKLHSKSEEEST